MKHAVIGPRGRINRILDKPNARTVEISDALAAKAAGMKQAVLHNGDAVDPAVERKAGFIFKWDEETKSWSKTARPATKPDTKRTVGVGQLRAVLIGLGFTEQQVAQAFRDVA